MKIFMNQGEMEEALSKWLFSKLNLDDDMEVAIDIGTDDVGEYTTAIEVTRKGMLKATTSAPTVAKASLFDRPLVKPTAPVVELPADDHVETETETAEDDTNTVPDKPIEEMTPEEFAALPRGVRAAHTRKLNKEAAEKAAAEAPAETSDADKPKTTSLFSKPAADEPVEVDEQEPPFDMNDVDAGDDEPTDEQLSESEALREMDQAIARDPEPEPTPEPVVETPAPAPARRSLFKNLNLVT